MNEEKESQLVRLYVTKQSPYWEYDTRKNRGQSTDDIGDIKGGGYVEWDE